MVPRLRLGSMVPGLRFEMVPGLRLRRWSQTRSLVSDSVPGLRLGPWSQTRDGPWSQTRSLVSDSANLFDFPVGIKPNRSANAIFACKGVVLEFFSLGPTSVSCALAVGSRRWEELPCRPKSLGRVLCSWMLCGPCRTGPPTETEAARA